jgi:hypothetical protein
MSRLSLSAIVASLTLSVVPFAAHSADTPFFKLEVQYPDNEIKQFFIPMEGLSVNLHKSKWHCKATNVFSQGKTDSGNDITQGIVACQKGDAVVSTWGMCTDSLPAKIVLSLGELNNKSINLFLECNVK